MSVKNRAKPGKMIFINIGIHTWLFPSDESLLLKDLFLRFCVDPWKFYFSDDTVIILRCGSMICLYGVDGRKELTVSETAIIPNVVIFYHGFLHSLNICKHLRIADAVIPGAFYKNNSLKYYIIHLINSCSLALKYKL